MSWVRVDCDSPDHPVVWALAAALKVDELAAFALVVRLTIAAARFTDDGDLSTLPPAVIARAVGWPSDPGALMGALLEAGAVVQEGERLEAWRWADDQAPLVERRRKDRERKRADRQGSSSSDRPSTSAGCPQDIPGTAAGRPLLRNETNDTDGTDETNTPTHPPAPTGASCSSNGKPKSKKDTNAIRAWAVTHGFEEWWSAYPNHQARAEAECAFVYDLADADREALLGRTRDWLARRERAASLCTFVPNPPNGATFIRKRRWEDEFKPTPGQCDQLDASEAAIAKAASEGNFN